MKGGMRHGQGTMTWTDGSHFTGHFEYNAAYGPGTMTTDHGTYTGRFANNMLSGVGTFVDDKLDSVKYEGQWVDDLQQGHGME